MTEVNATTCPIFNMDLESVAAPQPEKEKSNLDTKFY